MVRTRTRKHVRRQSSAYYANWHQKLHHFGQEVGEIEAIQRLEDSASRATLRDVVQNYDLVRYAERLSESYVPDDLSGGHERAWKQGFVDAFTEAVWKEIPREGQTQLPGLED